MDYKKFITGPLDTNTCVVSSGNGGACLIVDPSDGCGEVLEYLRKNSLRPIAILLTHGHFDHIMGVPDIFAEYGDVRVFIHNDDLDKLLSPTRNGSVIIGANFTHTENISPLEDGMMTIGEFEFRVLHVPGHTQGGCSFVFGEVCFCGDTIFAGNVGRCDLPGGNFEQLVDSIRKKILTLPPKTTLCPGHGGRTTVEREARTNPYLT